VEVVHEREFSNERQGNSIQTGTTSNRVRSSAWPGIARESSRVGENSEKADSKFMN
jgi:hypothetical protein